MLKQIKGYQTSDGVLHTNRVEALSREFMLELRGIFNQVRGAGPNLTTTDSALIVVNNSDKVTQIISKYRISINRAKGQVKKNGAVKII